MINCTIFDNELMELRGLRGTNSIIVDIANPVSENILVSTCIYIAIKGLNIIFLLLKW
jgi:hypothetical protein